MRNNKEDKALQIIKVADPIELLEFLILKQVRKSRNAAKSLLAHKQIKVNDKLITQFDYPLKKGDQVEVMKYDQSRKEKKLKGMTIVYEDDYIIVVDKEAGLLSVSTEKEMQRTVFSILNEYVKKNKRTSRVYVLHRLDQHVSGLMVFSKDQDIQSHYQKNWNILVPIYNYEGIVYGRIDPPKGVIKSWLVESKNYVMYSSPINNGGLEAITHYDTIKTTGKFTLLSFRLETRRKNQLRAQLKQLEHPIVGDKKYGAETNPIRRIALHAFEMTLKHPVSGRVLEFKSNMPKAMMQLIYNEKIKKNDE